MQSQPQGLEEHKLSASFSKLSAVHADLWDSWRPIHEPFHWLPIEQHIEFKLMAWIHPALPISLSRSTASSPFLHAAEDVNLYHFQLLSQTYQCLCPRCPLRWECFPTSSPSDLSCLIRIAPKLSLLLSHPGKMCVDELEIKLTQLSRNVPGPLGWVTLLLLLSPFLPKLSLFMALACVMLYLDCTMGWAGTGSVAVCVTCFEHLKTK